MKKGRAILLILIILGILGFVVYYYYDSTENEGANYPNSNKFTIKGNDVYNFTYLLQYNNFNSPDDVIDSLTESGYDLVVMDMYYSVGTNDSGVNIRPWNSDEIDRLHEANMIALCYISIGEAEDYRPYWDPSWDSNNDGAPDSGAPEWLDIMNPDWEGNYKVHYWDPRWQSIVYDYLDKIIAIGFDGVYLDIIDAYYYYEEKGMDNAGDLMVDFVSNISAYMKGKMDSSFVICPQNAEELEEYDGYLEAIDGIGREDVFYMDNTPQDNAAVEAALSHLEKFILAEKFVLDIEYTSSQDLIEDVITRSQDEGFLIHIAKRSLDTIQVDGYP